MISPGPLSIEALKAEDGMCVSAGVPLGIRDDPAKLEEFRQWVARCNSRQELKNLIRDMQAIEQRFSRGEVEVKSELRRVGESLIAMAGA
ncbi:MAG TPA: hypothetical protein VGI99_07270 [Gemmataceae bacterium]|jgi:hypothetical protein